MKNLNFMYWLLLVAFGILLFVTTSAVAHEKVVVVPLSAARKTTCTAPDEVLSQGQCWKDRNLGASQVATSTSDAAAFGDLYQWGRPRDGHQHRSSSTIAGPGNFDDPETKKFITPTVDPYDWRNPPNDMFWQGLGGINNPCPQGFRLPTRAEWEIELDSWVEPGAAGAFASPLKLAMAGYRQYNGQVVSVGSYASYWSSDVSGSESRILYFYDGYGQFALGSRATGMSVRCIKD